MSSNQDPEDGPPNVPAIAWSEPHVGPEAAPREVITAELVHRPETSRRPIWTAILVCLAAIVISTAASGVVLATAAVADRGPDVVRDVQRLQSWVEQYGQTSRGLLVMLLPTQVTFLLVACAAALISPRPFASRLSLGGGVLPLWTWLVFMIGTPIVGIVSSEVLSLFVTELSDNLKLIESMMRAHAERSLPALLVLVAVLPGLVEELMFRGYLQTRLAERLSPVWAILISALLFSAAHLDVIHMIGVLPLGLWLGAVAWRAGSIWPAAFCHTINNTLAVVALKYQPAEQVGVTMDSTTISVLILCGPAFLFSLYIFRNR